MTLAEGAGAPNVLVDARYRAIESVIPRVIPVSATLSCTGGEGHGEVIGDRGGHDRDEAGATEKNHLAAPPPHT